MSHYYKVERPADHYGAKFDEHEDATHYEVDDHSGSLTLFTSAGVGSSVIAVYPRDSWLSIQRTDAD